MIPDHIYEPSYDDPFQFAAPFLLEPPSWLILGGLGNSFELPWAKRRWPDVKIIGIDPDPRAIKSQQEQGWPEDVPLLEKALSDATGKRTLALDEINCASLHRSLLEIAQPGSTVEIATVRLDEVEYHYGPFVNSVVWLDLEGWEYYAVEGGLGLLASRRVQLWNVETRYCHEPENWRLSMSLWAHDYVRVYVWGRQWWGHNEIWVPKGRFTP